MLNSLKNFNFCLDFWGRINVTKKSDNMRWFNGKFLLKYLDSVEINKNTSSFFRFPIQYINRANLDFRGYSGTIVSGKIKENDKIVIYPSKKESIVNSIVPPFNKELVKDDNLITIKEAFSPMAITLTLKDEIDISRGDLIVKKGEVEPIVSDSFEAMLVWMDEEELKNREYVLKIYTKEVNATIGKILFKKDVNNWEKVETNILKLNDIARVQIDLSQKIAFDFYEKNRLMGAFVLIDKITNNTSAAGMIVGVSTKKIKKREYSQAEKALNEYIRKYYPEWGCKPC